MWDVGYVAAMMSFETRLRLGGCCGQFELSATVAMKEPLFEKKRRRADTDDFFRKAGERDLLSVKLKKCYIGQNNIVVFYIQNNSDADGPEEHLQKSPRDGLRRGGD